MGINHKMNVSISQDDLHLFKKLVNDHDFEFESYNGERYNRGIKSLIQIQNLMTSLIKENFDNKQKCIDIWNNTVKENQDLLSKEYFIF
jgi:hypothetical protein